MGLLHFRCLVLRLEAALFKLEAIDAHLGVNEFLLHPVVLQGQVLVFVAELAQLSIDLLQMADLAL